jgi:hypothetical protein
MENESMLLFDSGNFVELLARLLLRRLMVGTSNFGIIAG